MEKQKTKRTKYHQYAADLVFGYISFFLFFLSSAGSFTLPAIVVAHLMCVQIEYAMRECMRAVPSYARRIGMYNWNSSRVFFLQFFSFFRSIVRSFSYHLSLLVFLFYLLFLSIYSLRRPSLCRLLHIFFFFFFCTAVVLVCCVEILCVLCLRDSNIAIESLVPSRLRPSNDRRVFFPNKKPHTISYNTISLAGRWPIFIAAKSSQSVFKIFIYMDLSLLCVNAVVVAFFSQFAYFIFFFRVIVRAALK